LGPPLCPSDLYGRPYTCGKGLELPWRNRDVDGVGTGTVRMLVGADPVRRVARVIRAAMPVHRHEGVDRVVAVDRLNDLGAGGLESPRVDVGRAADDAAESLEASGGPDDWLWGPLADPFCISIRARPVTATVAVADDTPS